MNKQNSKDRGVIKKITLQNFLKYEELIFDSFGRLNVTIGPIEIIIPMVTAMLIGLGGNQEILGKKIDDFIKTDCERSKVEIVLKDIGNRTVTFTRVFDFNKSTYFVDNKEVTQPKFKETVDSFNIQLDNLYQFLPYDMVQDFAMTNPQELLQNIEKSVVNGELYTYHQELIVKREAQKAIETNLKTARKNLENHQIKFNKLNEVQAESRVRLEEAVENYKKEEKKRDKLEAEIQSISNEMKRIQSEIKDDFNKMFVEVDEFLSNVQLFIIKVKNPMIILTQYQNEKQKLKYRHQHAVDICNKIAQDITVLHELFHYYAENEKKIIKFQEQINELEISLEFNRQEVNVLMEKWLIPLQELIKKINNVFSSNFQEMNGAGEISLDPGENPLDYKDYGLKIRVKFQADDDFHEFTKSPQSEIKKAITTGMFILSFHELSEVPFRCVDEMNQGMKMVFNLVTRMLTAPCNFQDFWIISSDATTHD